MTVICSIIAKNYVAHARVLTESFLSKHPDGKCYVLVIDDFEGYIDPSAEKFELVRFEQLDIPNPRSLCFKYTVTELATAVKARLLQYLTQCCNVDRLLYLDPDIFVTGSLQPLFDILGQCPLVLTPHLDHEYPEDGRYPNDESILVAGMFNLGFAGISSGEWSRRFLRWLDGKLMVDCVVDPARGHFVDQRFFDLAFAIFPDIYIERSVAYNVAYWNLHSRYLQSKDGIWWCNGYPLRFFHFSDYKPGRGSVISGHSIRHSLDDRPDIVPLFREYDERLSANGYAEAKKWPYGYGRFADGSAVTDAIRREYRMSLQQNGVLEDPFADPAWARKSSRLELRKKLDSCAERWQENLWRLGGKVSRTLKIYHA